MNRTNNPLEQARLVKKLTGNGGEPSVPLPRGPSPAERELMQVYDLAEAKIRKLPAGLVWRELRVRRTSAGLAVSVVV